jgi:hypothetical protein
MNDRFKGVMDEVLRDSASSVRDRATWEGANAVERATFGRIFNIIEGALGLIALFGCFFISGITQNTRLLTYVCGILWVIPFIAGGVLLARFRHRLFVRVRGIMNNFLGGR